MARWTRAATCLLMCSVCSLSGGAARAQGADLTVSIPPTEFPTTLNPYQLRIAFPAGSLLFRSLAIYRTVDHKVRLAPDLLAHIPTTQNGGIKSGGRTIVLDLKPHQYWSSGKEITSDDIRFGWDILASPFSGALCVPDCNLVSSISLPSRYRAVFHLRAFSASFLEDDLLALLPMSRSWHRIAPAGCGSARDCADAAARTLVQDPSLTFTDASYWTDGPFQVASFQPGQRIEFRRMPRYHGKLCPGINSLAVTVGGATPLQADCPVFTPPGPFPPSDTV